VLVSIGRSYSTDLRRDKRKSAAIFAKQKITWPSVYDPLGWAGVQRRFNADGYGLILVDAQGIVRGVDLSKRDLKSLLEKTLGKKKAPGSEP
jgi:hypothetical protein